MTGSYFVNGWYSLQADEKERNEKQKSQLSPSGEVINHTVWTCMRVIQVLWVNISE